MPWRGKKPSLGLIRLGQSGHLYASTSWALYSKMGNINKSDNMSTPASEAQCGHLLGSVPPVDGHSSGRNNKNGRLIGTGVSQTKADSVLIGAIIPMTSIITNCSITQKQLTSVQLFVYYCAHLWTCWSASPQSRCYLSKVLQLLSPIVQPVITDLTVNCGCDAPVNVLPIHRCWDSSPLSYLGGRCQRQTY